MHCRHRESDQSEEGHMAGPDQGAPRTGQEAAQRASTTPDGIHSCR